LAVANYLDVKGHYPPAFVLGPDGTPWHSWRVLILPYIEEDATFKQYRFDEPWNGPHNSALAEQMPKLFAFHGTKFPTTVTNYLAVVGNETMWPGPVGRERAEIDNRSSETILIVENNGLGVHWMEPRDLVFETMNFQIDTPDGNSSWYKHPAVDTGDGSGRRLTKDMSADELRAALTLRSAGKTKQGNGGWEELPDGRQREKKP